MSSPPQATDTVHAATAEQPFSSMGRSRLHSALSTWPGQTTIGLLLGMAITGPAWWGDALLNLDLAAFDRIPVSPGIWGIGPELPRRAPAVTLLAIVSGIAGGGVALTAAFMTGCITGAFVGVAQLARRAPLTAALSAGALYALSPWLITRLAVGHLGLALTAALLPWVLPTLLRPAASLPRTFGAALALAMAGYFGGTISAVVIVVGVVGIGWLAAARVLGVWAVAQLPWVVPGLVAAWSSPQVSGAGNFATDISTPSDIGRLALGFGFWQRGNDIGFDSALVPLVGIAVVALALIGTPHLPEAWGRRATVLAGVGFALAAVQEIPMIGGIYREMSDSFPGSAARESQRFLVLFLVWLAPAAAFGIARLGAAQPRLVVSSALGVAAIAAVLAAPAAWGVGGRLDAVDLQPAWDDVRTRVERDPGTVLALPWNQYIDVAAADGRRVHHPIATLIDGDVLNSSDPELADGRREAADPREPAIVAAMEDYDEGAALAPALTELGVRWVVVVAGADGDRWAALADDPDLDAVVTDTDLELYEVTTWRAPALTADGGLADADSLIDPLVHFDPNAERWFAPHARGWLHGWTSVEPTTDGTMRLAGGAGSVWFWPALLVIGGYTATAAAAAAAARSVRRRDRDRSDACEEDLL